VVLLWLWSNVAIISCTGNWCGLCIWVRVRVRVWFDISFVLIPFVGFDSQLLNRKDFVTFFCSELAVFKVLPIIIYVFLRFLFCLIKHLNGTECAFYVPTCDYFSLNSLIGWFWLFSILWDMLYFTNCEPHSHRMSTV